MKTYTDSIIELNRDQESLLVQASYGRSVFFKDPHDPLTFIHFADVHAVPRCWERLVEYMNHYAAYIAFALHTGDYCGGSQQEYVDFYTACSPARRPVLNCVGNHDTYYTVAGDMTPKKLTHDLLFNHTEDWGVTFMDIECSMSYYRDFPENNIRLIVMDLYYDKELQEVWLRERLEEARLAGLHVITAMHQPTDHLAYLPETHFNTIIDYEGLDGVLERLVYEDAILDFIAAGGCHVCNLAGHQHHDLFGYSTRGVLNVAVECATTWFHWCDGTRVRGTRTEDCFNVVTVDADLGVLKLIRIGDNTDTFLRTKRCLCFDYRNRRMISTQ